MTFNDMLEQTLEILRRRGRVSYRALKLQFPLDDALLAALKDEIVEVLQLAVDQDGTMLVWTAGPTASPALAPPPAVVLPPGTATPDLPTAPMPSPSPTPIAPQQAMPVDAYAAPTSPTDAERRQLTVLFCDLVDSTALASALPHRRGAAHPAHPPGTAGLSSAALQLPMAYRRSLHADQLSGGPPELGGGL